MQQILYHGSKEMNPITADNLYQILPFKVSQLSMLYAKKFGVSIQDAIMSIYRSNTYKALEREESKLWHYGPVALMEYYLEHH